MQPVSEPRMGAVGGGERAGALCWPEFRKYLERTSKELLGAPFRKVSVGKASSASPAIVLCSYCFEGVGGGW